MKYSNERLLQEVKENYNAYLISAIFMVLFGVALAVLGTRFVISNPRYSNDNTFYYLMIDLFLIFMAGKYMIGSGNRYKQLKKQL
jgi:uncharacterized membrane protein YidH (DUF202 family)